MKKKLESELISIAHRVLKLKNRSETVLLQQEAKKIYEQLTILRFYEENFETLKNTISQEVLEEKLEQMALVEAVETRDLEMPEAAIVHKTIEEEKIDDPIEVTEVTEETIEVTEVTEVVIEEITEIIAPRVEDETEVIAQEIHDKSVFENSIIEEIKKDEIASAEDISKIVAEMTANRDVIKAKDTHQISMEDLLGSSYQEPEFIRVEESPKTIEQNTDFVIEKKIENEILTEDKVESDTEIFNNKPKNEEKQEQKSISLNDRLNTGIAFGLNDKIGFEKKLFNGSSDDFNRVISQLNTFDTFEEAKGFIESFVKPDYNNWDGQEEYENRFLEIIEKKFN